MNYSKKLKRNSSKKNSINRRNTKNVRNRRNTQNIRNRRRINKSIKYGGMDGFKLDDDIERLDDDIESIETTNVKLKPSEDMIGLLEGMDAGELAEYAKKPDEFGLAAQWKLQQLDHNSVGLGQVLQGLGQK